MALNRSSFGSLMSKGKNVAMSKKKKPVKKKKKIVKKKSIKKGY
tara:strand:- start:148 stop:279 length:132 start_codon:yes stop_codon:yes gene_type:complete